MSYAWAREPPRTASLERRATAFLADAALVFVLAWIAISALALAGVLSIPDVELLGRRNEAFGLLWLVGIVELPLHLLYFTLFEARGGRTPGKILLHLRVRRLDEATPTLGESFIRNLLRLLWVTPFGPAFVLLDLWALHATELDQRMGDLAVGTIVVDERFI